MPRGHWDRGSQIHFAKPIHGMGFGNGIAGRGYLWFELFPT
jgi:hypothetical protein